MKKVALVTCSQWPELTNDDQLLVKPLADRGFEVVAAPWDGSAIDWNSFEICVLRSTWNYHYNFEKFLSWLDRLEKDKVNLWNQAATVRWNSRKTYLLDLEKKGFSTVPTFLLRGGEEIDQSKIEQWNCEELVIKPLVGASAYRISKIKTNHLNKIPSGQDILIQPLMKEIKDGEWSFVFFDKKYSHSVIKTPAKRDFRVQRSFGGASELGEPDQALIEQAQDMVNRIEDDLLYTRLDAINVNGKLCLMELELIEPALYINSEPAAVEKLVQAILKRLS